MEKSMEIPIKPKIELHMTQQFHSWACMWKNKNTNLKRSMHPRVHWSTVYSSQDMEAAWVSISGWTEKMWSTHTYTHTYILVRLLVLDIVPCVCKSLTLGEAGWSVYRYCLPKFSNFLINLKLAQSKKYIYIIYMIYDNICDNMWYI